MPPAPRPCEKTRVCVWRRISPPGVEKGQAHFERMNEAVDARAIVTPSSDVGAAAASASQDSLPPRPRRRRHRKRKSSPRGGSDPGCEQSDQPGNDETPQDVPSPVHLQHPCVIGWNSLMDKAEEDLKNAVSIFVVSDVLVPVADIADAVAQKLEVNSDSLILRQLAHGHFLLMLPTLHSVDQLTSRWSTIRAGAFSLHCKRWSRFYGSSGASLPIPVEFELSGIPIHAWELSTVQHILNPFAWVQKVHEETLELKNLEAFRCYGWCYDLASIPHSRDLWITEPLGIGSCAERLSLAYRVQIKVLDGPRVVPDPVQIPTDMNGSTRQRRRFRSRSPPGDRDGRRGSTEDGVLLGRRSALERLGPRSEVQPRKEGDASQCVQTAGNYEILVESSAVEITAGVPADLAAVPNLAAVWGTMAPASEHIQGPLAPVDVLETVEQLVPNADDDVHAVSIIPAVNRPLLTLEESGLRAAVVPDTVPAQGTPHPVDKPLSVEPQDVTNFSGGGTPIHLQDHSDSRFKVKPPCFKVYLRRKEVQAAVAQMTDVERAEKLQEFMQIVTKPATRLLAAPPITKRKKRKTLPNDFNPRRSRRVAKLPPELGNESAATICRQLGFCDDQEHISFEDAQKYVHLFDAALSREHVAAMAALFGWELPGEDRAQN